MELVRSVTNARTKRARTLPAGYRLPGNGGFNKQRNFKNVPRNVAAYGSRFRGNYFASHISAMPQMFREQLRHTYSTHGAISLATSTFVEINTFVMNGLTIPDIYSGVQPLGFAKLIAFYQKAYVRAAKIKVTFVNTVSGAGVVPSTILECGISINTLPASLTSSRQAIGEGLCRYTTIQQAPDRSSVTVSVDIGKFMSVQDLLAGSQFYCTSVANATQQAIAHVWAYNTSGTTVGYVTPVYDVEYDVIFADPLPFT